MLSRLTVSYLLLSVVMLAQVPAPQKKEAVRPAVVDNTTVIPLPSVVTIPRPISLNGPIIAKPPDTAWWQKLEGSDFWLGEAGAAYLGLIAGIAALIVSILAYRVVRYQNRIIETQGANQIVLLEKQNAIQDEMAAWQRKQGESQDALSTKQFELQRQMAEWQKNDAEIGMWSPTYIDLAAAERKYTDECRQQFSFPRAPEDALNYAANRDRRVIDLAVSVLEKVTTLCVIIDAGLVTNQNVKSWFDNKMPYWKSISDHHLAPKGHDFKVFLDYYGRTIKS